MKSRICIAYPLLPLSLLLLFTALVRTWCVLNSDLPSGDEVNTYIFNGQRFADNLALPGLDNFPLTAAVYGAIIALVDQFYVTLSGVVARNIVVVVSGVLSVCFLYRGVTKATDEKTGLLAAAAVALFPGTLFAFRADISMYYLLMPALSLSFTALALKPGYPLAILPGIIGALFYQSRSDGLFIFLISVTLFAVYFRAQLKMFVVSVLSFVVAMGCYWGFYYFQHGNFGSGAKDRAIAAFYQAEGLHNGQGEDWHEYTRMGIERFGPPQQYDGSMALLLMQNSDAVRERLVNNLRIIGKYAEKASVPPWLAGVLLLAAMIGRHRRIFLLFAVPCIATSCIYLAFYYQISYFTLLSYGLAIGLAAGMLTVFEAVASRAAAMTNGKIPAAVGIVLAVAVAAEACRTILQHHPQRRTTADRYWEALTLVKHICRNQPPDCVYTPPYRGSQALPIMTDLPFPRVRHEPLSSLPRDKQRPYLADHRYKYLICGREHKDLWDGGTEGEDIVFQNDRGDVKVVALSLAQEFERSSDSHFAISPGNGKPVLLPIQQVDVHDFLDRIVLEASGSDPAVLLPSIRTAGSPIVVLKIALRSPSDSTLKVYYTEESGRGFDEKRSIAHLIRKGMNTIYVALSLGTGTASSIRLDPGTEPGEYELLSLEARSL